MIIYVINDRGKCMKTHKLSLALLSVLCLVGCDGNNSSPSDESLESLESIEESSESIESEESSESEEVNFIDLLSTRQGFKTYFQSWIDNTSISSLSYRLDDTKSYKQGVSEVEIAINQNELLMNTNFEGVLSENSFTETLYLGLFEDDNIFYNIKNNSLNPKATKYNITDEESPLFNNTITLEDASRQLRNNQRNYGASLISNTLGWNTYISGTAGFNELDWFVDFEEDEQIYYVGGSAVVVGSLDITTHFFSCCIDLEGKLLSGQLETTAYYKDDFDLELNIPEDDAEEKNHKKSYITSIGYEILEVAEEPSFDTSSLFIEEINSFTFVPTVYDEILFEDIVGEENTVFANTALMLDYTFLSQFVTYSPETAIDFSTIVITDSSDHSIINFHDDYGYWMVGNRVGESCILTFGNVFNPNMYELEVTIVANPTYHPAPQFSSGDFEKVTGNVTFTKDNDVISVNISKADQNKGAIFAIPTINEGPFNLSSLSFNYTGFDIYPSFETDPEFQESTLGFNYVYVEIFGYETSNTKVSIVDEEGLNLISFNVVVS